MNRPPRPATILALSVIALLVLVASAVRHEVRVLDADVTPDPANTPAPGAASTPTGLLFSDGFESGAFSSWSSVQTGADGSATVQSSVVKSGNYAARLSESSADGSYAYARMTLSSPPTDLTAGGDFQITEEGADNSNVSFFQLFDPSGAPVVFLYRQNQDDDQVWLQYGGSYHKTNGTVALNSWVHVDLQVVTAGSGASTVRVWLNGSLVYESTTASLGTSGVLTMEIGNHVEGQTFTLYADNITLTAGATSTATATPPTTDATGTPTQPSGPVATAATPNQTATPAAAPAATATPAQTSAPAAAATSIGTAVPAATATPTQAAVLAATAPSTSGHHIQTVFVIVMENHNWSQFKGSASAPYINNTLLPLASHAEQYYNPPGLHPSLGNYLWLESGQCFTFCGTDNDPSAAPNGLAGPALHSQLSAAGISWRGYFEGISDGTCPMSNAGSYAVRHNPFVYYNDVSSTATCPNLKSDANLSGDLANNTVARYNLIVPNTCDDGHDSCAPYNDPVKQTDAWLQANVPPILSSAAYQNGGALFITWDEAASGDGPIGLIVLSPSAKGNGYSNTIHYTHGSLLRTMEEIFGVSPFLGDAQNQTDLGDLFTSFP